MKELQEIENARQTLRKFEELMRRLVAVPRAELQKEIAVYERKKKQLRAGGRILREEN
jgi:hypothetical protein